MHVLLTDACACVSCWCLCLRLCSVAGNNLSAEGARYLAEALRRNTALRTLM